MKFIRKNGRIIPIKDKGDSKSSGLDKAGKKIQKSGYNKQAKANKEYKSGMKKAAVGSAIGAGAGYLIGKKFGISKLTSATWGSLAGLALFGGQARRAEKTSEEAGILKSEGKKIRNYAKMDKLKKIKKKGSSV